ncbi:hypothetical protein DBR39_16475 [Chryseobacterium sp. KBW03]|nr:hypothetical protein DBR39_16475 [Chryseobacterium sp. KBW03]
MGVQPDMIKAKEKELSIQLTDELSIFFQNISKLILEGVEINFTELADETIQKKQYLTLGEFWLYGDGDQLLYNLENHHIYIFAHENQPPKAIKVANSFTDFIEKKLVTYLKEYE